MTTFFNSRLRLGTCSQLQVCVVLCCVVLDHRFESQRDLQHERKTVTLSWRPVRPRSGTRQSAHHHEPMSKYFMLILIVGHPRKGTDLVAPRFTLRQRVLT